MTLAELKQIRLQGKVPVSIIKISLCPDDQFKEPVIRPHRDDDFSPLHGLAVDVSYWSQTAKALETIKRIAGIKPHSLYAVNHKLCKCWMVYWKGEVMIDDQTFLYDFERNCPYE